MPSRLLPAADNALIGPQGRLPAAFSRALLRALLATQVDDAAVTDARCLARWEAACRALLSFAPAEPVEAMLAAQAVAAHAAARDCLRRAAAPGASDPARLRASATDLLRACQDTLRRLERHRGWATGGRAGRS